MKKLLRCLIPVILMISSLSACARTEGNKLSAESWQIGTNLRYSPQSIWGDTLVAMDGRSITSYTLQTRESRTIKQIPVDYLFGAPAIYEDKVVWSSAYYSQEERMSQQKDSDALNWDVFLIELKTGEERQITTDGHAQIEPRIYGDTIVWLDNRHEADEEYPHHYDVYAYDLKTGDERRITATNSITEHDLGISGSLVVWTDSRNDDPASRIQTRPPIHNDDIYAYDLSTNIEHQITTDPAEDFSPVVDSGRVVWKRMVAVRNIDIFFYDIRKGQEVKISQSRYAVPYYYPAIYGDRILWSDSRISQGNADDDEVGVDNSGNAASGAAEIYLYDLESNRETLLVPSKGQEITLNPRGGQNSTIIARQVWLNPVMYGTFLVYTYVRQVDAPTYVLKLDDK